MDEDFVKLLVFFQNSLNTDGIERYCENEIYLGMGSKPIKIITGFRRSGKSYLVKRLAAKLISEGKVKRENIFYLNMEHYRLRNIDTPELVEGLLEIFRADIASPGKQLLIFDEVQKIRDWSSLIRTLYEFYGENCEIILTGSNSELLSAEIGSNLAGRFISYTLLPLSFKEYLAMHSIVIKSDKQLVRQAVSVNRYFETFVRLGALPETCSINDDTAVYSYLQGVISKVIIDDVVERFKLKQPDLFEKLLYYFCSNIGNRTSLRKLTVFLQKQREISPNTVYSYVDMMLKTFAVYNVSRFDWKQSRIFDTLKKYYAVDTGIVNSFDHTTNNYSKLLENIVFLELMRRHNSVYFGELNDGKEIDFIAVNQDKSAVKYQVTRELNDANFKRECSAFVSGDQYLDHYDNILLVRNGASVNVDFNGTTIRQIALLNWLLEV